VDWKYRKLENEYGKPQVFDYSSSPSIKVCGGCYKHYTNVGDGITCGECRGEQQPEDITTFVEETNEDGFPQMYQVDRDTKTPVCPQCHALVLPNKGQGMCCISCQHDADIEAEHDRHQDDGIDLS